MKILLLGPKRPEIENFLNSAGNDTLTAENKLSAGDGCLSEIDFIISYGYRHIIKKDVLDLFPERAVNLHISLLPWNRGADPNVWSFLEDTPKGVTIHCLDDGIDTGDVIAQKEVGYSDEDTLRTSYKRLTRAIEDLLKEIWPDIYKGKIKSMPQPAGGSFHSMKDLIPYKHLLVQGWDTPVSTLIGKALINKEAYRCKEQ